MDRIRCRPIGERQVEEFFYRTTVTYPHRIMEVMVGEKLDPRMELILYDDHMYKREGDEWRLLDGPA